MALFTGIVAITAAALSAGSAGAAPPPPPPDPLSRFQSIPTATVTHLPAGAAGKVVTVMLEVSGAPVTVVSAESATPLTKEQRKQQKNALKAQQLPIAARVTSLGGLVLGTYQLTYNGIKVRIAADKVNSLTTLPGVVGVHAVALVAPANTNGVPLVGAPAVWDGVDGLHGEGMKVAIIDTGIDYTHADFGGPGTAAAYAAAHATETAPADPTIFGPAAAKVKGGIDLAGDSYNADPDSPAFQPVPHPDANPLDCFGHGTHVAGTAAGFGVLADGTTYGGPYDSSTIGANSWNVGPGVAPLADLYAVRVFGCDGSTDLTVDAIEWAVDNDMDVINMSLGSPFGSTDDPSAVASDNAALDGVIVVASSGNEGHNPYMTGSPATATRAISVAAIDPTEGFGGATLTISNGDVVDAINANGAALPAGALEIVVLPSPGGISLGCNPQEYIDANVAGKLVVTRRGTCARVARAVFGQQAGAAAVLMVNNAAGYPPFEGPINGNPDTGEEYPVTIPFLGVPSGETAAMIAADGFTTTLTETFIVSPTYKAAASFTSAGARTGDSWLKPDVAAPGVSIVSAGIGTGNGPALSSGTSMAAPHTAGVAALVRQAHPDWSVEHVKAAIVNTADSAQINGYETRLVGAGLVQAPGATSTAVVASGDTGTATLNFGYAELDNDYSKKAHIKVENLGDAPATFSVADAIASGSPHTVSVDPAVVTIPAHDSRNVHVTLDVPAATAGDSSAYNDVAGLIVLTPAGTDNGGVALHVPYYLVPQTTSKIDTTLDTNSIKKTGSGVARTRNLAHVGAGTADFYAWGLSDGKDKAVQDADVRAIGVQTFPGDAVVFAISTDQRWSNAARNEFDIFVDVNLDGTDDYLVAAADFGAVTADVPDGRTAVVVVDLLAGTAGIAFLADAPMNSTTMALPVLLEQLCQAGSPCLSATNPRFAYSAVSFSYNGPIDVVDGIARFNAFTPAISNAMFESVDPGAEVQDTVTVNAAEWAQTPALGLMVVSHDNKAANEAQLIPVKKT